jgi:putative addiction module component (TIGR02574 family)
MELTAILDEIDTWPADQRIDLIEQVWDRMVDAGWQPKLTDDQKAELDRRGSAHEANPADAVSWESIVDRV